MRFHELPMSIKTRTKAIETLENLGKGNGSFRPYEAEALHVLNHRPFVRVHGGVFSLSRLLPDNPDIRHTILPDECQTSGIDQLFTLNISHSRHGRLVVNTRTVEFRLPEDMPISGCLLQHHINAEHKWASPIGIIIYAGTVDGPKLGISGELKTRAEARLNYETRPSAEGMEILQLLDVVYLYLLGSGCLLDPIVLADDQAKYEATKDAKYVERAQRRGVIGWDMGKKIEVGPHVRRPHFGIRWKGHGTYRPEIVPIRGSIINGQKLKLPEGYKPALDN